MKKKLRTKHKKKLTVTDIYNAINMGRTYPTSMSKLFKRSRSYMSRFCKKLCEQGKLEVDVKEGKGKIAIFYKIPKPNENQTNIGDYVMRTEFGSQYFSDGSFISFGIINYDDYFKSDKTWMLGPTLMEEITIDDCSVRIANKKTIMFRAHKIYGPTPQLAYANMVVRSMKVREKFLRMYPNFKLTELPTNEGPGNIGTLKLKQTINDLNPKLPIKTDDYTIDSTPERGSFEMKIKDSPLETAEKLQKLIDVLLQSPDRLDRIESGLEILIKLHVLKETSDLEKLPELKELKEIIDLIEKRKKPKKKQDLKYVG